MAKRTIYLSLGVLVLLFVLLASSGAALATTFSTPVDADYGHITNSVYLSQDDFPSGAPAAVVAGSESYADALTATVLAKAASGPLLLTSSTSLSSGVQTELVRLKVTKVYIVGLSTAIVAAVKAALPGLTATQIVVLTGANVYQTAALVAGKVEEIAGTAPARVFIVPGDVYGSSLAAAAVAAANGWPILLTPQAGPFPAASAQAITDLGVTTGVMVDTSVSPGVSGFTVAKTIMGTASTTDDPGARYSEAQAMAEYAVQQGWVVYDHLALGQEQGGSVAYSANFPDNVLLASHIARTDGAYLLSKSTALLSSVATLLKAQGKNIDSVDFMRPDYDQVLSGAWSFATIRQVQSLNSPRVTALSAASGALAGGGALTVTGTGFAGATAVRVGKTDLPAGRWTVNSDTSITIGAMPAATQVGAMEVLVSNYWHASPSSPKDVYFYTSSSGLNLAAMQVVQEAVKYLGTPYVWAGAGTGGFDCSGFTLYVYNKFTALTSVTLPHKSTYQANYGTAVSQADLIPGDLVFFYTPIAHVGMYVGNGLMINSPRSGDLVTIEDAYRSSYTTARRLISAYTRVEQTNSLLAYTGAWTLTGSSASASGGTFGSANSAGSSVTIAFTGVYLRLMSQVGTAYGLAKVTVDGKDAGTVNFYSASTVWQKSVWSTGMLPDGPHTVTISWTGTASGGGTTIGVDAFDVIGSFAQAHALGVLTRYQDTDKGVTYAGLWGNSATASASGGCFRSIDASGSAGITFQGTSAAWVATEGPGYGIGRVILDGVDQGTVDLYGSSTSDAQTVWSVDSLAYGTHTLSVHWTGSKNAAASASAINVDAFDVTGTLVTAVGLTRYEQTDTRFVYAGTWAAATSASASGGSYAQASTTASATVKFNGTYLSWVATAGPSLSKAQVSLDGGTAQTVDLARAAASYQQSVWATGTLASGQHTVVISWDASNAAGKYIGVDAFDVIGTLVSNVSTPIRYEQGNTSIVKTGTWADYPKSVASGGSYGRSSTSGASATIYFTGTRLDWIAMKGTTTGSAYVYLDGTKVATINLAATIASYQVMVWSTGTLASGVHTVRIERFGTNTLFVTLDAVDIWGTIRSGP